MIYKSVMSIEYNFSVIGISCWPFSGKEFCSSYQEKNAIKVIESAVSNGINFFDVAPNYGFGNAETLLGKVLKTKRNKVFIGTKCGYTWNEDKKIITDLSTYSITKQVEQSLKRLQTDYIDLYQCQCLDSNTSLEETMETLVKLKKEGKIRYIGFVNYSANEARSALRVSKVQSLQSLYNLVDRNSNSFYNVSLSYLVEKEIFPLCREESIAFFPYAPLFQGLLCGNYQNKDLNPNDARSKNPKLQGSKLETYRRLISRLLVFSKQINRPLNEIALNFLIQKDTVTSILTGMSDEMQLNKNLNAVKFNLTKDELDHLDKIVKNFNLEIGQIF